MSVLKGKYIRLLSLLIWLLFAVCLQAAPTGMINYQGRLLDKYGRRVNTPIEITFRIYNASNELLWQEQHDSVSVTDGLYSTILGSVTPLSSSLFSSDQIYLEISINGETLSPRQLIAASPFALTARSVNGPDLYVSEAGKVGVGTQTPAEKLDVSGTIKATGFKMPTGAAAGYVLVSDASGAGRWQYFSDSGGISNWVNQVFVPATNNLWTAVNARALSSELNAATNAIWAAVDGRVLAVTYNVATGNLWTAVGNCALITDYATATGNIWTAINARLPLSGGTMTGPVTNNSGFFGRFIGDGSALTNITSSNFISGAVLKTGDTMSGALVINSDLTVTGKTIYTPYSQTIADNNTTIQVAQAFVKIGTPDGALKNFSGCTLQIAPGQAGQTLILQSTNSCVKLSNGKGVRLTEGVNFYMSTNGIIQLIYDGASWDEIHRADNDDQYRP